MCPQAGMHHSRGDVEFALEFNGTLTGGRVVSLSCAPHFHQYVTWIHSC
jgi:hypothetical protein